MSDQGEKTCPLCAEEMDLTDQQLKPCKCGYEICVWCWHHIMDMAEKDDTEGRCPACRSPYDKEKIVGMTTNCERLVAELNTERKKSQKAKTKLPEGRKQLSSVRVIQRNLVYIVGLPLDLADEDHLQNKEFFGQYGKVLKVSMSRTAAGVIQQFPNNTCSVYITYSKEEEAIRCIQSVHGFVLDGRSLKACFGTTKYCHAWLRNVPCTNPDCLYLHEIGSQEDSFTKDEVISAYTRSRVQQITGATNNTSRRSGSMLPPPIDDHYSNNAVSAPKPIVKSVSSNATSTNKDSPPNGISGRSIGLPAAASWGMRASNHAQPASSTLLNDSIKSRPDTVSSTSAFSSAVTGTTQGTVHGDLLVKSAWSEERVLPNGKVTQDFLKPLKPMNGVESAVSLPEKPPSNDSTFTHCTSDESLYPVSESNGWRSTSTTNVIDAADHAGKSQDPEKVENVSENGQERNPVNVLERVDSRTKSTVSDHSVILPGRSEGVQQPSADQFKDPLTLPTTENDSAFGNAMSVSRGQVDWRTDPYSQSCVDTDVEDDVKSFDNQRLKDPEVVIHAAYLPNSSNSLHVPNHSRSHSLQLNGTIGAAILNADVLVNGRIGDPKLSYASSNSTLLNGHFEKPLSKPFCLDRTTDNYTVHPKDELGNHGGGSKFDANGNVALDMGESSIISNILSLDLDGLDDSLTSPQTLARWFGETDKQPSPLMMPNSCKAQSTSQSRFSFARQESCDEAFDINSSFSVFSQLPKNGSFGQESTENRGLYLDKLGMGSGFSSNYGDPETLTGSPSVYSSHKPSVSRAQISAPPGFSGLNRAPPPGFPSHDRVNQTFDSVAGNNLLDASLLRNVFQIPSAGNIGSVEDIEFIDPAILAVGKGRLQGGLNTTGFDMRSNFPQQLSAFDNEARLQHLLMQRPIPPQQSIRYAGDSFSSRNDSFGISSRFVDHSPTSNLSSFPQLPLQQPRNGLMPNGHWDTWNGVQSGNSIVMEDILRNERMGHKKFYNSGYEETKFRMPSSGDLYNRTFEM